MPLKRGGGDAEICAGHSAAVGVERPGELDLLAHGAPAGTAHKMKTNRCHSRTAPLKPKASGAKEVPTLKSLKLPFTHASLLACVSTAFAQSTAFTWQGRLTGSSHPANGLYDLRSGGLATAAKISPFPEQDGGAHQSAATPPGQPRRVLIPLSFPVSINKLKFHEN